MQIEITLEQLLNFLKGLNPSDFVKDVAVARIKPILEESLNNVIYTSHSDTVTIRDKQELRRLIRSRGNATKAPPYNPEYLARKFRMGENYPHKYENYGFAMGTEIYTGSGGLKMVTTPTETNEKGSDYLAIHERTRSVLKRSFLDAWESIIKEVIKTYAEEAKK
jgi:hypothetical protein